MEGAGRGEGDGGREVLKCLWTRVIQGLPPTLQLQIARESWRVLPARHLGMALPPPLVRVLARTLLPQSPTAAAPQRKSAPVSGAARADAGGGRGGKGGQGKGEEGMQAGASSRSRVTRVT